MPLAFDSLNHGTVAFGFFNIETDLLLLEHQFFFANRFCDAVSCLCDNRNAGGSKMDEIQGYTIVKSNDIGDLMGAIHGICYTGFIGEIYRRFPFPRKPELFKQNPKGYQSKPLVASIISKYGQETTLPFGQTDDETFRIGDCLFNKTSFHALITYVWKGGYPLWKEGIRPDYALEMKEKVTLSSNPFFRGIRMNE